MKTNGAPDRSAGTIAYVDRLLQAPVAEPPPAGVPPQTTVEALSAREREVLQLIANGATNEEIARRLVVSPNTVKSHVKNIYGKLDAGNRTQAVARARALGLL